MKLIHWLNNMQKNEQITNIIKANPIHISADFLRVFPLPSVGRVRKLPGK